VPELLKQYDFKIYRTSGVANNDDTERYELVADYKHFVESSPKARPRRYEAFDHDMTVRLTVARQRKREASALDAGAFFLTTDFTLYRYDSKRMQSQQALGLVVLPNQLLQLLRPFVATTDDFNRRFIEAFAIPEFRSIESDYSSTQANVLSYLSTYSNMSEQTASRILANDLLMNQLKEVPEDSEQFEEYVESAVARDNENLLDENSRLQALVEATERKAETAREESASREQQTRETSIALDASNKLIVEAKGREAERNTQIEQLRQQNKSRMEENEKLAGQITNLHSLFRYAAAFAILVFGLALIAVATILPWPWLEQHAHRLALYVLAVLILGASAWAAIDKKRRHIALGTVVVGALLALIPLLES
jgi:hypothetical protein